MKKNNNTTNTPEAKESLIPPLDVIDLDSGADIYSAPGNSPASTGDSRTVYDEETDTPEELDNSDTGAEGSSFRDKLPSWLSRINFHIVFLVLVVLLILGIAYKFSNWGVLIHQDDIFSDGMGTYDNSYDMMLPVFDENGDPVYPKYDSDTNILLFGNAPFADDRDSQDNLANIIQKETDANVYNCSIGASYLSTFHPFLDAKNIPWDSFNFYWLCTLAVSDAVDDAFLTAVDTLGEQAPPEAMEVYNTLNSIDLNEIDVICIMYDASDYLAGLGMYSDENYTDIETFTGNLTAGIELVRDNYPHIRFIVMSPAYAFGLDDEGNYISSDIKTYGQHFLSTYVIKQAEACSALSVTFIDNLYGTIHEDNADQYLSDHFHLNVDGRERVAQRFLDAYYYYNDRE